MINRRQFTVIALAATTLGVAAPAIAHERGESYILPEEYLPREGIVRGNSLEASRVAE